MDGRMDGFWIFVLCPLWCFLFWLSGYLDLGSRARSRVESPDRVDKVVCSAGIGNGRMEGNVLFNDTLNTFFILRLYGVG